MTNLPFLSNLKNKKYDWNAAEGEEGHILNRTHYTWEENQTIIDETLTGYDVSAQIGVDAYWFMFAYSLGKNFIPGYTYTVVWNGTTYESLAVGVEEDIVILGNLAKLDASFTDTGEPFVAQLAPEEGNSLIYGFDGASEVTVSITGLVENVSQLDPKFLPNGNITNSKNLRALRTINAKEESDEYQLGIHSLALGCCTEASGNYAVSIGQSTKANAYGATAIGTVAEVTDQYGVSIGMYTTAASYAQTAMGKYNILDADGKYLYILGNGTKDTARSNAHTVDFGGNAWYAGTVEAAGIILTSPNGTRYQITVDDTGTLSAAALT